MPCMKSALPKQKQGRASASPTLSQRMNAERLTLLAWTRAVLLQFAHPLVAAGVYEHSSFMSTSWAGVHRLKRTVTAMLSLTFGDDADRERALERIRAIHRRVHGTLSTDVGAFRAGTPYSAEDPELVLWVHATLVDSIPMFFELLEEPLSSEDRDTYCREAASVALALNARPDAIPRSAAELQAYLEGMYVSGRIAVGPQARELGARILHPFGMLGAPAASINRLLALALLPEFVREQYCFAWTRRDERAFSLVVPALRRIRKMLPDAVATWGAARSPGAARSAGAARRL